MFISGYQVPGILLMLFTHHSAVLSLVFKVAFLSVKSGHPLLISNKKSEVRDLSQNHRADKKGVGIWNQHLLSFRAYVLNATL